MDRHIFHDRNDAARQLAEMLKPRTLHNPLVLGIPRGGIVTGATLARELGADLDIALSRKLRHPHQAELAIGAISEEGALLIDDRFRESEQIGPYLQQEREQRMAELQQRQRMFRNFRPAADVADRSVILTDDGIATGSTMFAALQFVKTKQPRETIVAVPVAPAGGLDRFQDECDAAIALFQPEGFSAIGEFYDEFPQVDDRDVCELLREFAPSSSQS